MSEDHSLRGQFLVAMPNMGDQRFDKSVIYLCAHSADGAMGFMVNRSLQRPNLPSFLAQLGIIEDDEVDTLPDDIVQQSLYSGGPVEPGRGFVLHSPDFHSATTLKVDDDISLTATLEVLRAIATGGGPSRSNIMLGYAGWASGQLEEEIVANGWLTAPGNAELLFDDDQDSKYERVLRLMGVDPLLLFGDAGHA